MDHLKHIEDVAREDVAELLRKEKTYQGSWKKRGGVGAAMMLLRKADRLDGILCSFAWDVFAAVAQQPTGEDGSALAEIRDLRRYCLLIEAEMTARGTVPPPGETFRGVELRTDPRIDVLRADPPGYSCEPGTPEDGGHHARQERLEDDEPEEDVSPAHYDKFYFRPTGGSGLLVRRDALAPELWEHLPRLYKELNDKEHQEMPRIYDVLYEWNEAEVKWQMLPQYVKHWGKP